MALAVPTVTGNHDGASGAVTSSGIATAPGDLIVVAGAWYSDNNTPSAPSASDITDSVGGNTWNYVSGSGTTISPLQPGTAIYWSVLSAGHASAHTFTYTPPGSRYAANIAVLRATGQAASPVDKSNVRGPATGTINTGTTGTLAQADELVVAVCAIDGGGTNSLAADTGFTNIYEEEDGNTYLISNACYRIVSATTAQNPTWTWGGGTGNISQASIATFKDAGAGGVTYVPPQIIVPRTAVHRASSW